MDFSSIKNILFDLGGVIINIAPEYTYQAFAKLTNTSLEDTLERFEKFQIFKRYEIGELSDEEVKILFRKELDLDVSDSELVNAWNALLLDIPSERIDLLKDLKSKYRIFLLSNTNNIHINEVNQILHRTSGIEKLDYLFEKIYYSFEIKMSKPDVAIYKQVLLDNNLKAEETLFIDDNKENIEGAKAAGINVLHVQSPQTIIELLKNA